MRRTLVPLRRDRSTDTLVGASIARPPPHHRHSQKSKGLSSRAKSRDLGAWILLSRHSVRRSFDSLTLAQDDSPQGGLPIRARCPACRYHLRRSVTFHLQGTHSKTSRRGRVSRPVLPHCGPGTAGREAKRLPYEFFRYIGAISNTLVGDGSPVPFASVRTT